MKDFTTLQVRPYQLMAIINKLGEGKTGDLGESRLHEIYQKITHDPDTPIMLRCNAQPIYAYQNPGTEEDTPEGALYNIKRDIEIIQHLGLVPGSIRPARDIFARIFREIPTARGICYYDDVTAPQWKGADPADWQGYDKAVAQGMEILFPARNAQEMERLNRECRETLENTGMLYLRPIHALRLAYLLMNNEENDKYADFLRVLKKKPDIPVRIMQECDMLCSPCKTYDPDKNTCFGGNDTMSLRDLWRDLNVLQKTGLTYGDELPANELFDLISTKISAVREIFAFGDGVMRSMEWTIMKKYRSAQAPHKIDR